MNISDIQRNRKRLHIPQDRLEVHREDIRTREGMEALFSEKKVDVLIHLAAMAGVRPSIEEPELYYDVNIQGTICLLEAARKAGVKKLIFASSSSVYGNNKKIPFAETDPVDHPISPYAASKKAGELLCHTYSHLYGIRTACLRFFTVYGPRQRPDLAISKFTRLILEGKPPFYGDGTAERDYTYIDDIVDGILKTLDWVHREEGQPYEIFNLGESRTVSLREMLFTIEKALKRRAEIQPLPLQPGDEQRTFADISKARTMVGYCPSEGFAEGVQEFVEWFLERRIAGEILHNG